MDEKDVNAEFLHNVQTAVDSTGVGGRVGVINTEQGPLTVIFMDENVGGASAVSSARDTTIQYVDTSDTSTMQYIADGDGTSTTLQYVTDDATTDATNVQYYRDESGQLIQYVTDAAVLAGQASNTSDTLQNGATEVVTYLVDEAGNIIQYISSDGSTGISQAGQFGCDTLTYNTNQALETTNTVTTNTVTVVPQTAVQKQPPTIKLDNVDELEPVIKLMLPMLPDKTQQATPQMVTLVKQPSNAQATSITYKLQQTDTALTQPIKSSNLTVQPIVGASAKHTFMTPTITPSTHTVGPTNAASGKSTIVMPTRQLATSSQIKQPISLIANKQTNVAGQQPSLKQMSSILTKTGKSSSNKATVVTLSPSVFTSRPVLQETSSAAKPLSKLKVTPTTSDIPKIHLVSPIKPKFTVPGSKSGVIKTVQHVVTPSASQTSTATTTSVDINKRNRQPMSTVLNKKVSAPSVSMSETLTPNHLNVETNAVSQMSTFSSTTVNLIATTDTIGLQTATALSSSSDVTRTKAANIVAVEQVLVQAATGESTHAISTTTSGNSQVNVNVVNRQSGMSAIKPGDQENVLSTESNITACDIDNKQAHILSATKSLLKGQTSFGENLKSTNSNMNSSISIEGNNLGKSIEIQNLDKEIDLSSGNIIDEEKNQTNEQIESETINGKEQGVIMETMDKTVTSKANKEMITEVESSAVEYDAEVELNQQGLPMKCTYVKYKCDKCHFRFVNKSSLDRHALIHLQDNTYRCDICHKKLLSAHSVKRHKCAVCAASNIQCPQCKKQFRHERYCRSHMRLSGHKGEVVMLVRNDDEEQMSSEDTTCESDVPSNIMKSIFGIRKVEDKSERCRRDKLYYPGITYKYNYDTGNDRGYKCSICKRYFATKKSRLLHKKRVHEDVKCKFCERSYNNYYLLKTHTRNVHTGPFTCKTCKHSFDKRDAWIKHTKSHLSDRWKCYACDKGFCKLKDLNRHKSSAHKEQYKSSKRVRPSSYKPNGETCLCDQCGKSFGNRMNYRKHLIWTHGGYRPHTCNSCGAAFTKKKDFVLHKLVCGTVEESARLERIKRRAEARNAGKAKHTGAHLCDTCGRSFITQLGLKAHRRAAHSDFKNVKPYGQRPLDYEIIIWKDLTYEEKQNLKFGGPEHMITDKNNIGNDVTVDPSASNVTDELVNQTSSRVLSDCYNTKPMSDGTDQIVNNTNIIQDNADMDCTLINTESRNETQTDSGDTSVSEYRENGTSEIVENLQLNKYLKKIYRCKFCQLCFKIKQYALYHTRLHKTICTICNKKFNSYYNLRRHNHMHHSEDKRGVYACPHCPKSFLLLAKLQMHYKHHKGPWKCEIPGCEQVYEEKTKLNQHRLTHTLKCLCGKYFKRRQTLLSHFAVHRCCPGTLEAINSDHGYVDNSSNVREAIVPSPESNSASLNVDIKDNGMPFTPDELASIGEPVPCPECNKQFMGKNNMERHRIRVHGEKSERTIKCDLCDFTAVTSSELVKHREIHYRTFKCNLCTKSYDTDEKLQKHVASHYKDKYQCFYCQKIYLDQYNCKKHILHAHSLQQSDKKDLPQTSNVSNILPELPEQIFQPSSLEESEILKSTVPHSNHDDLVTKSLPSHIPSQEVLPAVITQPVSNVDALILPTAVAALRSVSAEAAVEEPDNGQSEQRQLEIFYKEQSSFHQPVSPLLTFDKKLTMRSTNVERSIETNNIPEPAEPTDDIDIIAPDGLEGFAPIIELPFKCRQCGQEFSNEKLLRNHVVLTYIDNYFCTICNEHLRSKFRLQRHVFEMHSVGKPYKCATCSQTYNSAKSYWRHAQFHARLITCDVCQKAFNQQGDLRRHVYRMHGIGDSYICAFCGATFQDRQLYRQHRTEVHGLLTRNYRYKTRPCPQIGTAAEGNIKTANEKSKNTVEAKVPEEIDMLAETVEAAKLVMDTANIAAQNQSPADEHGGTVVLAQQSQPIQLPSGMGDKGDVTIQLYSDGTMMTTDGTNVDYGSVDLSSLGIDPDMLKDNANIELIIVEGDGNQIKQQLENDPSKLTNVLENNPSQTVTVKKTPVQFKSGKFKGPKIAKYNKYLNVTSKSSRIFNCRYCPRTFNYFRHLRCHEIAHTSKKSILCPLCQRSFVREANLVSHLELHKKKTILPVQEPKFKVRHRRTRDEIANDSGNHTCDKCRKTFKMYSRLLRHINEVHLNKSVQPCPICGQKLKSESSVQRHLKIHIGPFNCHDCSTQFTSRDDYIDHQAKLHPLRHFACRICTKQFTTRKFLFTHLRKVHVAAGDNTEDMNLKPYACKECGKCFGRKGTLNKHMIVHTGERKFQCNICGYRSAYNWKLKKHIQNVHLDQKNYQCSDCGVAFKTSKSVNNHKSIWHSGPYTCNVCSDSFYHKQELQQHQLDVHGMNSTECSVCKLIFTSKNELAQHHSQVHVQCSQLCDLCGNGFPHKTKLKEHLLSEHFDGEESKLLIAYPNMRRVSTSEVTCSSGSKRRFSCDFCDVSFCYKVPFKAHLKAEHFDGDETALLEKYPFLLHVSDPPDPVVCDYCGKTFAKLLSLNVHLKVHGVIGQKKDVKEQIIPSDEGPDLTNIEPREMKSEYACDKCGRGFSRLASLKKHVASHEEMEIDVVMKQLEQDEKMRAEEEKQIEQDGTLVINTCAEKEYNCQNCSKVFKKKSDIDSHHLSEHNAGIKRKQSVVIEDTSITTCSSDLTCDTCGKTFSKNINLRRHSALKHGIKVEIQKVANEGPVTSMETNILSFSSRKSYVCKVCEEIFKQIQQLDMHIATAHKDRDKKKVVGKHTVKTNLKCRKCGKSFSKRKSLKRHMQLVCKSNDTESDDKTTSEDTGTGISQFLGMNFSLELKRVKAKFDIEAVKSKTHKCKQCGEAFSREATLKKHLLLHEESSDEGDSTDTDYDVLDVSKLIFPCRICGNMYASTWGIIQHSRDKHDVDENVVKAQIDDILSQKEKNGEKIELSETKGSHSKTKSETVVTPGSGSPVGNISNEETYICAYCGNIYASAMGRAKHIQVMHPGRKLNCHTPATTPSHSSQSLLLSKPKATTLSTSGRIITKKVIEGSAFQCDICAKVFAEDINLRRHMTAKHGTRHGNSKSDTESQPPNKKIKLNDEKGKLDEYRCTICSKSLVTLLHLRRHMLTKHKTQISVEILLTEKTDNESAGGQSQQTNLTYHSAVDKDCMENAYECNVCCKLFAEFLNLRRHMKMKHDVGYKVDLLQMHPDLVKKMTIHTCRICLRRFPKLYALKLHMRMKHNQQYEDVENHAALNNGQVMHDADSVVKIEKNGLECNICHCRFVSQKTLNIHMRKHTGKTPFTCSLCDKKLISKFKLECHYNSRHGDMLSTMVKCKTCLSLFTTAEHLKEHQVKHKKTKELVCRFCKLRFTDKKKHEEHVKVHTDRPHKCDKCDKAFRWRRNLTSHVDLFHNTTESLTCGVCYKTFANKEKINRHTVVHTVKRFSCMKCGKKFGKDLLLQSHIKAAHKEKRRVTKLPRKSPVKQVNNQLMTCNICNKGYHTQEKLLEHMLLHTSVEPSEAEDITSFACTECGKTFDKQWKVRKHIKGVHKITSAKSSLSTCTFTQNYCTLCKTSFTESYNYSRHMRNVHNFPGAPSVPDPPKEITIAKKPVCHICKNVFTRQWNLKQHVKTVHKCKMEDLPAGGDVHVPASSDTNLSCYYCSDCKKVHWSVISYTAHLKEMHPDRPISELDEQIQAQILKTEIKTEAVEPDNLHIQQSPKKRAPTFGPVKLKCEFCGRVHWTEKSFEAHMQKFHPEADNPIIELVNDSKYDHFEAEGSIQDSPVIDKQLCVTPVVLLKRILEPVEGNACVDSTADPEVTGNDNLEGVTTDLHTVVNMDSDLQDMGNNSIVMQEDNDSEVGAYQITVDSDMSKLQIDIDPSSQSSDMIGIIVDKENLENEHDVDSPQLVPSSPVEDLSVAGDMFHDNEIETEHHHLSAKEMANEFLNESTVTSLAVHNSETSYDGHSEQGVADATREIYPEGSVLVEQSSSPGDVHFPVSGLTLDHAGDASHTGEMHSGPPILVSEAAGAFEIVPATYAHTGDVNKKDVNIDVPILVIEVSSSGV